MIWAVVVTNDETQEQCVVMVYEADGPTSAQVLALHQLFRNLSWRHATAGIPVEEAA